MQSRLCTKKWLPTEEEVVALYLISDLPYAVIDGDTSALREAEAFEAAVSRFRQLLLGPPCFIDLAEAKSTLCNEYPSNYALYIAYVPKTWNKQSHYLTTQIRPEMVFGLILHPLTDSKLDRNCPTFIKNPGALSEVACAIEKSPSAAEFLHPCKLS